MAKWGEGDPRWIVEERPDATNVNNWHWTEKRAYQWSKDKIAQLFGNLEINDSLMCVTIKEIKKCEGDASANNRKAKLIFLYEWDIEMEWEGNCAGSDSLVKGKIEIPNLSDENTIDEVTIDITLTDPTSGDVPERIRNMMRSVGCTVIRDKLSEYVSCLMSDFSQGLILPTKGAAVNTIASTGKTELNKNNTYQPAPKQDGSVRGVPIKTKQLKMNEEFKCTAEELYRAFTNQEMVKAFTLGPAQVVAESGGRFQLLDTNVTGKFVKLTPPKEIEMQWRFKSWPADHHSKVVIKLDQENDCTKLTMTQDGVPENELDRTRVGWQRYYFDSIKRIFGFGATLSSGGF